MTPASSHQAVSVTFYCQSPLSRVQCHLTHDSDPGEITAESLTTKVRPIMDQTWLEQVLKYYTTL